MDGICTLCKQNRELKTSHIIPSFVFQWMRKTGSEKFRNITTPNKREQDGIKLKLLCGDCEGKFSKVETWFTRKFFHPILDRMLTDNDQQEAPNLDYDEHLYVFCLSVLWRILVYNLKRDNYPKEHKTILNQIEDEWRCFLNQSHFPRTFNSVHMWLLDKYDFEGKPEKYDLYIMRATDGTIAHGTSELFIFAKFARFQLFAPIKGFDEKNFTNTKINPISGEYLFPQTIEDERIGDFLVTRAMLIKEYSAVLSDNQLDVINKQALKEKDKLYNSDLFRSIRDDHEL
jgi:hypothetical protein